MVLAEADVRDEGVPLNDLRSCKYVGAPLIHNVQGAYQSGRERRVIDDTRNEDAHLFVGRVPLKCGLPKGLCTLQKGVYEVVVRLRRRLQVAAVARVDIGRNFDQFVKGAFALCLGLPTGLCHCARLCAVVRRVPLFRVEDGVDHLKTWDQALQQQSEQASRDTWRRWAARVSLNLEGALTLRVEKCVVDWVRTPNVVLAKGA